MFAGTALAALEERERVGASGWMLCFAAVGAGQTFLAT
jgi:hypothetical protein